MTTTAGQLSGLGNLPVARRLVWTSAWMMFCTAA